MLNADCRYVGTLRRRSPAPVLTVGFGAGAEVRTSDVRLDAELRATFRLDSPWGSEPDLRLAVRGVHQVTNAAQAAAVALHLGVPITTVVTALASATSATWRMELSTSADGIVVLNDAYNASPTSMRAALETFGRLPVRGRRIAVLGEMRELGAIASAEHDTVGALVATADVGVLVTVGPGTDELAAAARARGVEVHRVADGAAAAVVVSVLVEPGDAVLVKASRLVGLERVAAALVQNGEVTS